MTRADHYRQLDHDLGQLMPTREHIHKMDLGTEL